MVLNKVTEEFPVTDEKGRPLYRFVVHAVLQAKSWRYQLLIKEKIRMAFKRLIMYRICGTFDGDFNLAVWRC